jgi:predicted RecA/RadA family phage recombinase
MAIQTLLPAGVTVTEDSGQIMMLPEAATQSFKKYEFVYLSSGKVTACADDATTVAGIALTDASGTTDRQVTVYVPNHHCVFSMSVYHSTPASAVTAITLRGTACALQVDSNKHYVDIEDTGTASKHIFIITDISPEHSVGDQYGRVYVKIKSSGLQLG